MSAQEGECGNVVKRVVLGHKEHVPFLLFILTSFLYVFYPFHFKETLITADAVLDAQIAKNVLWGEGLGWPATMQPPFHAILTAAIYPFIGDILAGGIVVSKIMWWLLSVPVYFLSREFCGNRAAFFSALLVFFIPHFHSAAGSMEPTVTYTTLLMSGICFTWFAFFRESIFYAVFGGIFFSIAYLTRSEGLLILLVVIICLLFTSIKDYIKGDGRSKRIAVILIVFCSFMLTSLPYILFLKDTYGKVVLSPKSSYVQTWMKWRVYEDNNLGEIGNPELWGLSKNGKLMWQEPKGLGDLVSYLLSNPKKSLKVYLDNFSRQLPGLIPNNSGQWRYPQVYPFYFVIPAVIWIFYSFKGREERLKTIYLLSPFAILFVLPIFTEGWWKYLLPYSPLLVIMAVAGVSFLTFKLSWKPLLPLFASFVVLYSIWAVKASAHADGDSITVQNEKRSRVEDMKKAGEWAQQRFEGNPNYMLQWVKLVYYLNGRWTAMPAASIDKIILYAKKNNVDYIVFEALDGTSVDDILRYMERVPALEVVDVYNSSTSDYSVVFIKIKE